MATFLQWMRRGNAFVWGSGGLLAISLTMIVGLVGFIAVRGLGVFWPSPLVHVQTPEGPLLGEITAFEPASGSEPDKVQFRVGNRDVYGQDFRWLNAGDLQGATRPPEALLVERLEYGMFMGRVSALNGSGVSISTGPVALEDIRQRLPEAKALQGRIKVIEREEVGRLNQTLESLRLELRSLEGSRSPGNPARIQALEADVRTAESQYQAVQGQLEKLRQEAGVLTVTLETVDGQRKEIPLASIVRLIQPNDLSWLGKVGVYVSRFGEFLWADPRESNTEGGIFPALFGTVMMVLTMTVLVVPLGVVTALFLREYAKDGWMVRIVRIAVNNLAGVPSIVFGVFGLGFFVYSLGGAIDQVFCADKLPTPTFGTGGILWASLTLALLTVPVVVVATEEAIAAVPRSQREASLALGATQWQTIRNVVLPGAAPGILTGLILAMARGAGEVAPLMLTGVVKLAPSLPIDGTFPYMHLDRKFMHLGFHIYDVGFQSPNSEAAKPMVFMTSLLLLAIVVALNLFALRLRRRLRARLAGSHF